MTRNGIIRMAQEAGLCNATGGIEGDSWCFYDHSEEIERFFHLAAAAGANAALEAAARQALEAWDNPVGAKDFCVAMDALRAVLKERKK